MLVLPFLNPKRSMASTIFMPPFTLSKTMSLPSNHSVLAVQKKTGDDGLIKNYAVQLRLNLG